MFGMSKKSVVIFNIRTTLSCILISFFSGFVYVFSIQAFLVVFSTLIVSYVFLTIFYSGKRYKNTYYKISPNFVISKSGVSFSKTQYLNLEKLQFIKIIQTPLQKYFLACSIILYTYSSKLILSDIDLDTGIKIKSELIKKVPNK